MKVLQINNTFRYGSTGKIVASIHDNLKANGYESVVCYGRGQLLKEPDVYKTCTEMEAKVQSLLTRIGITYQYGGSFSQTKRLISIIKKEQPDIVHIHCVNDWMVNIYSLFDFLSKAKVKTVVTHHAEFLYTGSCSHAFNCLSWVNNECRDCQTNKDAQHALQPQNAHSSWLKFRSLYSQFDSKNLTFVSVSPWVQNRARLSLLNNSFPQLVVYNGVDTNVFKRRQEPCLEIKGALIDQNTILHVTAEFSPENKLHPKGGWYIVQIAKNFPNLRFVVVASHYKETQNHLPENVVVIGRVTNQVELAKLYSNSSLTIITSKRETFSMVTAESLCCGTPVVGFKSGGPESIGLPECTEFIEYGDVTGLSDSIVQMQSRKFDRDHIATKASNEYSNDTMTSNYINIYKKQL